MELNKQIQKAIAESLPEATAGELKKYLEKADAAKTDLKLLQQDYDELAANYEDATGELRRLRDLKLKRETIDQENATLAVDRMKHDMDVQMLELREQHAKDRVLEIRNMTETVFKSNRMNYNLDLSLPLPVSKDQYGNRDYNQDSYADNFVSGSVSKDDTQQD